MGFTIFDDAKRVPNVSTKFGSFSINVAMASIFPTENVVTFTFVDRKSGKYEANADVNDIIINRDHRDTLQ